MKRLIFILFVLLATVSFGQKTGVYDNNVTATDTIETEDVFVYQSEDVPVLDITYHEFSVDNVTWTKDTTGANYVRFSNDVKETWWNLPYEVFELLWTVENDTLKPAIGAIVGVNELTASTSINSPIYEIDGSELSVLNISAGVGIDGYVLTYEGGVATWTPQASGSGATYGRNVNTNGIGVYQDTTGSELQFRGLYNTDGFIDLSLEDSTITLEWDGSGRLVTAGIGLSGGGTLESDITIDLYIPELLELTEVDADNDYVPIYDLSTGIHKKVKAKYFLPNVSVNGVTNASNVEEVNLIAGSGINLYGNGNGGVIINATGGSGDLPVCSEGEFLAFVDGEWTCVNVCDYICADTVIQIVENYKDTVPSIIEPSGDVVINFSRLECEDSVQVLASDFVKEMNNLTTIKITSVPSVGELSYGGVSVTLDQELDVIQGVFDSTLYYLSDDGIGSAYTDLFTFQALYSSNTSYLGEANVSASVTQCVTESICFGYLYNWYAVDDSRSITSDDNWTVPTRASFETLRATIAAKGWNYDGTTDIGTSTVNKQGKALANDTWDSSSVTGAVGNTDYPSMINISGFSHKGSGVRSSDGRFLSLNTYGYLYTSEMGESAAYNYYQASSNEGLLYNPDGDVRTGRGVRFVKETTLLTDGETGTYTGNDGKTYNTICIGTQEWMTENLEETRYRNGETIANVTDDTEWVNSTTGAWCVYDNDMNNACKNPVQYETCFGFLYNGYVTVGSDDISSGDGWAVPTTTEYEDFLVYVGNSSQDRSYNLRSTNASYWNLAGYDIFNFNAVGSGYRESDGIFSDIRVSGNLMTSDEFLGDIGALNLDINNATVSFANGLTRGYAIRLVKDAVGVADGATTTYTGNDGKTYGAVCINEQYWLTHNLEETKYQNGDYIGGYDNGYYNAIDNTTWSNLTEGALCMYKDDEANVCYEVDEPTIADINYGYLYNWYVVDESREVSSSGWHVPSLSEWETLETYAGGATVAGGKLKETGLEYWIYSNIGATNELKLNIRGGGIRNVGVFENKGVNHKDWTTTPTGGGASIYIQQISTYNASSSTGTGTRARGYSIRLIKDSTTLSHGETGTYTGNDGTLYRTICIGTQEWLADNLAETKYRNGDWITGFDGGVYTAISNVDWTAKTTEAMCVYDDDLNNK